MPIQMTAEQLLRQVSAAREEFVTHSKRERHDLVKIDFDRWVDERTPIHMRWNSGPMDQHHEFQRAYARALFTTTVLSPFASELFSAAYFELTDLLIDIEKSYREEAVA